MTIPIFIIDTFTSTKFKGNPTVVCLIENPLGNETMHSIAKEFNLPVTAFVEAKELKDIYKIKYFTLMGEIPACGHATLATANVIFERNATSFIKFETIEDIILEARLNEDVIYLTYPRYEMENFSVSENILQGLGLKKYKSAGFCKELETLFIEMENPHFLKTLQPNFKMLIESSTQIKEVVVTSISDNNNYDFILRSFCPWIGIDEDPVTGSIHSVLANFWKDRLKKNNLTAYQASERGGEVYIKAFDDKVELGGKTITLLRGELNI